MRRRTEIVEFCERANRRSHQRFVPPSGLKSPLDVRARRDNVVAYERNSTNRNEGIQAVAARMDRNRKTTTAGIEGADRGSRCSLRPVAQSWLQNTDTAGTNRRLRCNQCRSARENTVRVPAAMQPSGQRRMAKEKPVKCPKCGYEIEVQQNRAAKSRWSGMSAKERAAEMSRIRRKGIKKPKRIARHSRGDGEPVDVRHAP